MKKRLPYIIAFVILLVTEIYIGVFVHDKFIRPYVGDVLVTVLICNLVRCVIGTKCTYKGSAVLCGGVLIFSACAEISQYFRLDKLLRVNGTVLGVIFGSSFDVLDIVCYAVGCALFFAVECAVFRSLKKGIIKS